MDLEQSKENRRIQQQKRRARKKEEEAAEKERLRSLWKKQNDRKKARAAMTETPTKDTDAPEIPPPPVETPPVASSGSFVRAASSFAPIHEGARLFPIQEASPNPNRSEASTRLKALTASGRKLTREEQQEIKDSKLRKMKMRQLYEKRQSNIGMDMKEISDRLQKSHADAIEDEDEYQLFIYDQSDLAPEVPLLDGVVPTLEAESVTPKEAAASSSPEDLATPKEPATSSAAPKEATTPEEAATPNETAASSSPKEPATPEELASPKEAADTSSPKEFAILKEPTIKEFASPKEAAASSSPKELATLKGPATTKEAADSSSPKELAFQTLEASKPEAVASKLEVVALESSKPEAVALELSKPEAVVLELLKPEAVKAEATALKTPAKIGGPYGARAEEGKFVRLLSPNPDSPAVHMHTSFPDTTDQIEFDKVRAANHFMEGPDVILATSCGTFEYLVRVKEFVLNKDASALVFSLSSEDPVRLLPKYLRYYLLDAKENTIEHVFYAEPKKLKATGGDPWCMKCVEACKNSKTEGCHHHKISKEALEQAEREHIHDYEEWINELKEEDRVAYEQALAQAQHEQE